MDKIKSIWKWIQEWTGKYVGGLFMDQKDGVSRMSLGRTAMIIIIALLCWFWRRTILGGETGVELPDGLMQAFYIVASYVFGTKISSKFSTKKGDTIEIGGKDDE